MNKENRDLKKCLSLSHRTKTAQITYEQVWFACDCKPTQREREREKTVVSKILFYLNENSLMWVTWQLYLGQMLTHWFLIGDKSLSWCNKQPFAHLQNCLVLFIYHSDQFFIPLALCDVHVPFYSAVDRYCGCGGSMLLCLTCSCIASLFLWQRETIYTLSDYHDSVESASCKTGALLQLDCQLWNI